MFQFVFTRGDDQMKAGVEVEPWRSHQRLRHADRQEGRAAARRHRRPPGRGGGGAVVAGTAHARAVGARGIRFRRVLSSSLSVWLWLVVNDRKFLVRIIFFSHTNQPAVLLYEPAMI